MLEAAFQVIEQAFLVYMLALNAIYAALVIAGWGVVRQYVRMRPLRDYQYVGRSEMSMPVTVIIPAFNEAPTIVDSVRSLLRSQFNRLEVIVVNDGSTDGTLDRLTEGFGLVDVDRVPRSGLPTQPVRRVYRSVQEHQVLVIDKANGGKADALNAGLNYAQYPLVCAVDADTILDPGALARLVWEFQSHAHTVATGGIVRIVNGSVVDDGAITAIRTPRGLLANIQIAEYLRAFLGGRLAWSRWNMLLIISGAFGLFRRDVVVEAGGYDTTTVTEDAELILRIRRMRADAGLPCRITFFPDPICWTEAPESMRQLARQRDRWQRGLAEMLVAHRRMLLNPRYGRTGMLALPYYWIFELLEPVVTVIGLTLITIGFAIGLVKPFAFALLVALVTAYGLLVSLVVILMEEQAFRRYPDWKDLGRMTIAVLVENFGYRQWQAVIRFRALFRVRSAAKHWGEMTRAGFTPSGQQ